MNAIWNRKKKWIGHILRREGLMRYALEARGNPSGNLLILPEIPVPGFFQKYRDIPGIKAGISGNYQK
jgi:hypothetical protein